MPATCPQCDFPLDPGAACPRCQPGEASPSEPVVVAQEMKTYRSGIAFDRATPSRPMPAASSIAPIVARTGAALLDSALVGAVTALCLVGGGIAWGPADLRQAGGGSLLPGVLRVARADHDLALACALLLFAVASGYAVWFLGAGGRTPGMARFGLRVVTTNGSAIGFGGALSRWGATVLAVVPLGLGIAWAAFDPDGRGLHDRMAGTRVVNR
jgi:uncharacterized RDD family membrane protein YckC